MDAIQPFVDAARSYCAFLEQESAAPPSEFAANCLKLVLPLYETAMRLPHIEGTGNDLNYRIGKEQWKEMYGSIGRRVAWDFYWHAFRPVLGAPPGQEPPEITVGCLADDLTDVWCELKEGLIELDSNSPDAVAAAESHWRFSFDSHWGQHVIDAIGALHAMRCAR